MGDDQAWAWAALISRKFLLQLRLSDKRCSTTSSWFQTRYQQHRFPLWAEAIFPKNQTPLSCLLLNSLYLLIPLNLIQGENNPKSFDESAERGSNHGLGNESCCLFLSVCCSEVSGASLSHLSIIWAILRPLSFTPDHTVGLRAQQFFRTDSVAGCLHSGANRRFSLSDQRPLHLTQPEQTQNLLENVLLQNVICLGC